MARPRKPLPEKISEIVAEATPEERADLEDAFRKQFAAEAQFSAPQRAISSKLRALESVVSEEMLEKLRRVEGDWRVRCLMYDPNHEQVEMGEDAVDEDGDPHPNAGFRYLFRGVPVEQCSPDIIAFIRSRGGRGRLRLEFVKKAEQGQIAGFIEVPFVLSGEQEARKPAFNPQQAQSGNRDMVLMQAIGQIAEMVVKSNEQTQAMLKAMFEQQNGQRRAPDQDMYMRLNEEREKMRAEIQAMQINDPKYKMGGEVLNKIIEMGWSRLTSAMSGDPTAAQTGASVAATGAPAPSLGAEISRLLRAGREDFEALAKIYAPKEPSITDQIAQVAPVIMQGIGLWNAWKTGGPSALGGFMADLQKFAAQNVTPALGQSAAAPVVAQTMPAPMQASADALLADVAKKIPSVAA